MIGVMALSPTKQLGKQQPRATTYYVCDAPGNLETMAKTMTDAALHKMTDEPPMCLQCPPWSAQ